MIVSSWWAFHRVGEFFVVCCGDDDLLQVDGDLRSLLISRHGDQVVHPGRHICITYFDIIFASKKDVTFGDVYSNSDQERGRNQRLYGILEVFLHCPPKKSIGYLFGNPSIVFNMGEFINTDWAFCAYFLTMYTVDRRTELEVDPPVCWAHTESV